MTKLYFDSGKTSIMATSDDGLLFTCHLIQAGEKTHMLGGRVKLAALIASFLVCQDEVDILIDQLRELNSDFKGEQLKMPPKEDQDEALAKYLKTKAQTKRSGGGKPENN